MTDAVARQVVLYGPPAAGKFTVARALADRYDLGLLDNHLTVDVALRLYSFGTTGFESLVDELREVLFRSAARGRKSTVATFVYAAAIDVPYVERLRQLAAEEDVELAFVQLRATPAVLEARVVAASRAGTGKIRDVSMLKSLLERWDLYERIHQADLAVDNSTLPPDDVAILIGTHLGLEPSDA